MFSLPLSLTTCLSFIHLAKSRWEEESSSSTVRGGEDWGWVLGVTEGAQGGSSALAYTIKKPLKENEAAPERN